MEPPSGLVGTVESVLCFPSRCGNPRCERISISGVSFHRPPFSFFFAPFFFLCACPQFSTEKYHARVAYEQRSPPRLTYYIPGFCPFLHPLPPFFFSSVLRKRYDSVPVSMMWAWSVSRSSIALHNRAFGNMVVHSENGKFVVTITAALSALPAMIWNNNSAAASGIAT